MCQKSAKISSREKFKIEKPKNVMASNTATNLKVLLLVHRVEVPVAQGVHLQCLGVKHQLYVDKIVQHFLKGIKGSIYVLQVSMAIRRSYETQLQVFVLVNRDKTLGTKGKYFQRFGMEQLNVDKDLQDFLKQNSPSY